MIKSLEWMHNDTNCSIAKDCMGFFLCVYQSIYPIFCHWCSYLNKYLKNQCIVFCNIQSVNCTVITIRLTSDLLIIVRVGHRSFNSKRRVWGWGGGGGFNAFRGNYFSLKKIIRHSNLIISWIFWDLLYFENDFFSSISWNRL